MISIARVTAAAGLVAALAGCGGGGKDEVVLTPMAQAAVQRIQASESCVELQGLFDSGMAGAERSVGDTMIGQFMAIANAADARMREVGCYG